MAVLRVLIAVNGRYDDGRGVTQGEFIEPLDITDRDPIEHTVASGDRWLAGQAHFPVVRLSEFTDDAEPHERLFASLECIQRRAAAFLDARDPTVFETMRARGMQVQIFIDVRMDQDQMELLLDPSFVAACGRHRLPIYVMTNDISAAEALARQSGR